MTEHEKLFLPFTVVAGIAVIILMIWAASRNYTECRATPHTVFYCLTSG